MKIIKTFFFLLSPMLILIFLAVIPYSECLKTIKTIHNISVIKHSTNLHILGYEKKDSWRRNSTTDLPQCYSQLTFKVLNQENIIYNLSWTTTLDSSSASFKIGNLTTGYNTVSWVGILSDYEDFGVNYNLRVYLTGQTSIKFIYTYSEFIWRVDFPRYMPLEVASLYITPNNPMVKELTNSISGWPKWLALQQWVAWNIKYPQDDANGDGKPDYDYIYHGQWDYWQLPIETLQLRTGDCEDYSILLCSLLRAAGYNENDVFVMVGPTNSLGKLFYGDSWHAWVRINIGGKWTDIEPQDRTVIIGFLTDFACFDAVYQFNDVHFTKIK